MPSGATVRARQRAVPVTPALGSVRKNLRYKMRGGTGMLVEGLRTLESEVNRLSSLKRKRLAITAFFNALGMGQFGVIPMVAGLVNGAQARLKLENYLDKHRNHPRVMLYLAEQTNNPYLRSQFRKLGAEEIMLRKIIRGPEQVKAALEHNMLARQMNPHKAIAEAYRWGVQKGHIKARAGEKL